jgi:hypothetical protein
MSRNFSDEFRVTNLSSAKNFRSIWELPIWDVSKFFRPIGESAGIFQIFQEFRHNFQNFTKDSIKILKIVQFSPDFHHNFTLFPPNSTDFPQEIN